MSIDQPRPKTPVIWGYHPISELDEIVGRLVVGAVDCERAIFHSAVWFAFAGHHGPADDSFGVPGLERVIVAFTGSIRMGGLPRSRRLSPVSLNFMPVLRARAMAVMSSLFEVLMLLSGSWAVT